MPLVSTTDPFDRARTDPARRLCGRCAAAEPVSADGPIWPLPWRCPACGWDLPSFEKIAAFAPGLADTIDGFDPNCFEQLARIEAGHFWFVPRNRLLCSLVNRFFPSATRLLEVGCGNAFVLSALARARVWDRIVGAELHPSGLKHARARLPDAVELVQMDARHIPARNAFDVIGAFDVLEHIAEDEAVLVEMHRALRPGGGVILAVPQHPRLWSRADDIAYHVRRYRRDELETKLRGNGFGVVFSTSYTALLLPLMAASRLKERRKSGQLLVPREHGRLEQSAETSPPKPVNAMLKAILHLEVGLTMAGVRWPIGGSRVVVAMKDAEQLPRGAGAQPAPM